MPFTKGRTKTGGRKAGTSNKFSGIRDAAQLKAEDALAVLVEIMQDTTAPAAARISAANAVLDRAHGKPRQEIDSTVQTNNAQVVFHYPDNGRLTPEGEAIMGDLLANAKEEIARIDREVNH